MKRVLMFTLLFAKRLLKKPTFLVILLLMPVLTVALKYLIAQDSDIIKAAVYDCSGNEKIEQVTDKLISDGGAISYYRVDSLEQLKVDVLTNNAECGFVFDENLYQALIDENAENAIPLYKSTKSTMEDIAKEEVFVALYHTYAPDLLKKYMDDSGFYDDRTADEKAAMEKFMDEDFLVYCDDGGAFNIVYNDDFTGKVVEEDIQKMADDRDYLLRPVMGTVALFVMMAALAGAIFKNIDEKQGVYATMGYRRRPFINMLVIFIPTFMAAILGVACKYVTGIGGNFFKEVASMAVYCVLLTGFAYIITAITRSAVLICSMLPMFTIVSLLGCNMFVNIVSKVHGMKTIRFFLPPNYYLEQNRTVGGMFITLGLGAALMIIGVFIDRRKMR
ncbi:MAG: hypothetical protein K5848_08705 [Lachnospiraceae bacterium]|nr:hypothetical protein [Lachnospiraceae bacterium]